MIQLQRILLPTDFSEHSAAAIPYACDLCEQFGAELHLFHVLESYPSSTPAFGGGLALPSNVKESKEHAELEMAKLIDEQWRSANTVVGAVADGHPFVEIVQYGREHKIDLIIMGSHGRSGLVHAMIGSVADRVVRKAPCPVLIVKKEGHQFVMV